MRHSALQIKYIRTILLLLLALGLTIIMTVPSARLAVVDLGRSLGIIPPARETPLPKPVAREKLPQYPMELVKSFSFSDPDTLREWEEKVFKGRVAYQVEQEGASSFVRAKSDGAASALYYKINLDPDKSPVISWRWRVEKFPTKSREEELESQAEHDFAGRVYVIFPTMFILNSRVLEYVWAEKLQPGTTSTSPYSKNIKLVVLESGSPKEGEWRFEERDVVADYQKAFGDPPDRNIGAVAFMTNAEHTGTSADAMYDDIKLGYKDQGPGGGDI